MVKPNYYNVEVNGVKCDVIDIINGIGLNFNLGNVLKYIVRDKQNKIEDLKKAMTYIAREIERLEFEKDKERKHQMNVQTDNSKHVWS